MNRKEILEAAQKCVCGDREQDYGSPENNFGTIATMWTAYLRGSGRDTCINSVDVASMMALLKIARIASGTFKDDSFVDGCGYLACGGELAAGANGIYVCGKEV